MIGTDDGEVLDEFTPPAPPPTDDPFSPNVCQAWELAVHAADTPQTRKIILRIGFVLHADHGALATLARLARCFVGGRAGAGTQSLSWLPHADFTQLVADIVAEPAAFSGTYLAVSPTPATNAHFMRELRRVLHRPWAPPAPAWLVRLGCFLMRTEPELALRSRRCYPRRLLDERGFRFRYPTLPEALAACYPRP